FGDLADRGAHLLAAGGGGLDVGADLLGGGGDDVGLGGGLLGAGPQLGGGGRQLLGGRREQGGVLGDLPHRPVEGGEGAPEVLRQHVLVRAGHHRGGQVARAEGVGGGGHPLDVVDGAAEAVGQGADLVGGAVVDGLVDV